MSDEAADAKATRRRKKHRRTPKRKSAGNSGQQRKMSPERRVERRRGYWRIFSRRQRVLKRFGRWSDVKARTLDELMMAIKLLREELGMTQEELSQAAGLQEGYVSKLEHGRHRLSGRGLGEMSLAMLLDALGVRLALVPLANVKPPSPPAKPDDLQVLTIKQAAATLSLAYEPFRKSLYRGDGPKVTQVSAARIGIRRGDLREWLDQRSALPSQTERGRVEA